MVSHKFSIKFDPQLMNLHVLSCNMHRNTTSSPAVVDKEVSGIAEQHVDDGHSRRGNFGGSLVRSMFLSG